MAIKDITRKSVHFWIYYGALCLLVISLPSSRFFLTVSLIALIVNWFAEGHIRERFMKFTANRAAVAFTLIYLSYIVSLIWSVDLKYAIHHDLLHKSPTLFMPIILTTSQKLNVQKIRLLLFLFIASVLTVSFIGLSIRIIHPNLPFREASPFMPGIFLGLMLVLAAIQLPDLVRQVSRRRHHLLISLVLSAWLIFFLFYIRSLSGIASFTAVSVYLLFFVIKRLRSLFLKALSATIFILLLLIIIWPLKNIYRQTHSEVETDFATLEAYTVNGNRYLHDTTRIIRENGHLVYIYIADEELCEAWNKRSELDYHEDDLAGWALKHTLYRYMSSKGLKKDKHDFNLLTDSDIRAIEEGIPNYLNLYRPGIFKRVYEEMMGLYIYRKSSYTNPTWGSLSKRIDLWRASIHAFGKKPLFGWGIGSIIHAVDYGFNKNSSPLNSSPLIGLNLKPHNQYMYILLTQGVVGLILLVFLYVYFIVKTKAWKILMFRIFVIIFAVNFLANNSLEGQLGQNLFVFFTFFYSFFYPQISLQKHTT
ncbi:MAG: O-antigen ligase family protein [Bacteroidota bacterium]